MLHFPLLFFQPIGLISIDKVVNHPQDNVAIAAGLKIGWHRVQIKALDELFHLHRRKHHATAERIYIKQHLIVLHAHGLGVKGFPRKGKDKMLREVHPIHRQVKTLRHKHIYHTQRKGVALAAFQHLVDIGVACRMIIVDVSRKPVDVKKHVVEHLDLLEGGQVVI